MKKLSIIFLLLTLGLASCQNKNMKKYPELKGKDGIYAEFITNNGTFVAKLFAEKTPLTVSNFVDLAEGKNDRVEEKYKGKKFFNGLIFHRIIKDFMIQGGDPLGTGSGNPGYKFADEFSPDLVMDKKGVLAMANSGPGTNGSQFFITLKETPWLNGKHTVFGEIVIGQDVVDALGLVEVNKTKPVNPVTIKEVNIIRIGKVKINSFDSEMEKAERLNEEKNAGILKVASETASTFEAQKLKAEELPSGLKMFFTQRGDGVKPAEGANVLVNYAGFLTNGTLFDSNREEIAKKYDKFDHRRADANGYAPTKMQYSKTAQLIPGFREGLLNMNIGDKATIFIPAHLAYGERGIPNVIPPNSDLIFELEITGALE